MHRSNVTLQILKWHTSIPTAVLFKTVPVYAGLPE